MSKQTLKFSDIVVNKKEFYTSKQAIPLDSVNTNNIVVSYMIKHNLSDCNWTRTLNHLVHKRKLNHLAKLAK